MDENGTRYMCADEALQLANGYLAYGFAADLDSSVVQGAELETTTPAMHHTFLPSPKSTRPLSLETPPQCKMEALEQS